MSEAEDLLTASLNLDVDETFLEVHYRSRDETLIGFSNAAFYNHRLQPIPGHPNNKALRAPIELRHIDGVYENRSNRAEAVVAVDLIEQLLAESEPPSIGVACFNIVQRDLILDLLGERAECSAEFSQRLDAARERRGRDSFEGLFVRNLENVQGDERDHIIISTTFGRDPDGKFRRNFGAVSRSGGERRLNVLVTRARSAVHVLTSIPRGEYRSVANGGEKKLSGRQQLYAYLLYAETVGENFQRYQDHLENLRTDEAVVCDICESNYPSDVARQLGIRLRDEMGIGSTVHWGNDGFCVDVALTHPALPEDVTIGVLSDFNRFRKTPDPVAWEHFRTEILKSQGWRIHRVWSPIVFRESGEVLDSVCRVHDEVLNPLERFSDG